MVTRNDLLTRSSSPRPLPPFAVTPHEAKAMLEEPAEFDAGGARPSIWEADKLDPILFSEAIDGIDWQDLFVHGAPEEMAAFRQTLTQVIDAFGVDVRDLPFDHPLHKLQETVLALWCACWSAGVRAGVSYEHLRLAMIAPRMICQTCDGQGETWGGHWYRDEAKPRESCRDCGGAGTVPTPAATLSFGS